MYYSSTTELTADKLTREVCRHLNHYHYNHHHYHHHHHQMMMTIFITIINDNININIYQYNVMFLNCCNLDVSLQSRLSCWKTSCSSFPPTLPVRLVDVIYRNIFIYAHHVFAGYHLTIPSQQKAKRSLRIRRFVEFELKRRQQHFG